MYGVSKAITPCINGNINFILGSADIGLLSNTENRVSAATKPLGLSQSYSGKGFSESHEPHGVSYEYYAHGWIENGERSCRITLKIGNLILQPMNTVIFLYNPKYKSEHINTILETSLRMLQDLLLSRTSDIRPYIDSTPVASEQHEFSDAVKIYLSIYRLLLTQGLLVSLYTNLWKFIESFLITLKAMNKTKQ